MHDAIGRSTPVPRVSILMPVHNGASFLRDALDSLLAQSFERFELVIVDDASIDRTPAILADYAARDARIRCLRNPSRQGVAVSLNRGLQACRAALVARADADDVCLPDRLSRQVAYLDQHPHIGVLSCGFDRIDATGRLLRTEEPVRGPDTIRFWMMFMNCLPHSGVMFRKHLVLAAGGYDPAFWTAQDSDLWARMLPHTAMDNLPGPLVRYRVHISSMVRTRGAAGLALSLSVPQRQLSAYLGHTVTLEEVRVAVGLFQSFSALSAQEVRDGARLLARVDRIAARREPEALITAYRTQIVGSLLKQARRSRKTTTAVRHCLSALTWQPNKATLQRAVWLLAKRRDAAAPLRAPMQSSG